MVVSGVWLLGGVCLLVSGER